MRALPDRECARYLLTGLSEGFRIGFNYRECEHKSARSNMLSAKQNRQVVEEYLREEKEKGRIVSPVGISRANVQVNHFGVIPKGHDKEKWRLILDLSHPEGSSVNDGIDPSLCSLTYTLVDWAAKIILATGRGALLAKVDLESAYRMVPVHSDDRPLLGMTWRGSLLVDTALPFGLRSAPKIFNTVADCLQWILREQGVTVIHYLDDYLICGPRNSGVCASSLQTTLQVCDQLGVKVSQKKLEGPTTKLTFLGILLDTERLELRLPEEKLLRLRRSIEGWRSRTTCTKRELLSLLGHLHHAGKVVRPGRSFVRRIIDLSKVVTCLHHHIRLNAGFRSDMEWWSLFLADWNGIGMLAEGEAPGSTGIVTSDASGNWGCGAFTRSGRWFQYSWPESWAQVHITVKELLPIVMASVLWGRSWAGKKIQWFSDNSAAVSIINSGKSKDPLAMHLARCLFFFQTSFGFSLKASHIAGKHNIAADALSRDNIPRFFQQVPAAKKHRPTPVPDELQQLLIHHQPDWTSPTWRQLFVGILQKV